MKGAIVFLFFLLIQVSASIAGANLKTKSMAPQLSSVVSLCKNESKRCLLNTTKKIHKFEWATAKVYIGPHSSILFPVSEAKNHIDAEFTVIRGLVRVEAKTKVTVKSSFGEIHLSEGVAIIEANDERFRFTNISSQMFYQPLGEKMDHFLPAGYASYFSHITQTGVAEAGLPRPAEIEPLLKRWAKVVPQNESRLFALEVRKFTQNWLKATQQVGGWYMGMVERDIASLRAEEQRQARLKALRDAEDRKYRELFRKRIFEQF